MGESAPSVEVIATPQALVGNESAPSVEVIATPQALVGNESAPSVEVTATPLSASTPPPPDLEPTPIDPKPARPDAVWTVVLADHEGIARAELEVMPRWTFTRNERPECELPIDVQEPWTRDLVDILRNGIPRLRAWRETAAKRLVFHGLWTPMREDTAQPGSVVFRGPGHRLETRNIQTEAQFAQVDAGMIAWQLIDQTNQSGPTGLVQGTIRPTVLRDRTYERGKQLAEARRELTEVIGGFDFEDVPVFDEQNPEVLGEFEVWPEQGINRAGTVVFELGDDTLGNLDAATRTWALPVNHVTVLGADGLVGVAADQASIDQWGRYEHVEQATDVTVQATLDDKAQALIRPEPVRVIEITPGPDAPRPWDDFWLADTITARLRHGSLLEDVDVRVNQITVEGDQAGRETYRVAVEAPAMVGPLRLPPNARDPFRRFRDVLGQVRQLGGAVHRLGAP